MKYVIDYVKSADMLRDLADLAGRTGNERLRRVWLANLERERRKTDYSGEKR